MAAVAPYVPKAGQTFGFNDPLTSQISKQYGLSSQQIQGLRGGQAGQATPTLALGNTGYNLTMGAGGGGYSVQRAAAKPLAPAAPAPGYPGSAGGGTSSSTSGGRGPGTTFNTPVTPGEPATIQNTFRDQLLKQLGTDANNVNLTDADLAPQARAFQNAQQRSQERAQQDLAEQGFAGGALGTGAYGSDLRQLEQARGESEGAFDAGLLKEARGLRQQNLNNALTMGQGQIQSDEALRQAINSANQQYSLGAQDIGLRQQLGQGQLSLGLLQAMLQDRQSNNRLGLDAGIAGQGFNQSAMMAMLGLR